MEIPEEIKQYKRALNSLPQLQFEACLRAYENPEKRPEVVAQVQKIEEYLTNPPKDPFNLEDWLEDWKDW